MCFTTYTLPTTLQALLSNPINAVTLNNINVFVFLFSCYIPLYIFAMNKKFPLYLLFIFNSFLCIYLSFCYNNFLYVYHAFIYMSIHCVVIVFSMFVILSRCSSHFNYYRILSIVSHI